jgi:pimeloyl-ACP methyl ester carboxylesterase
LSSAFDSLRYEGPKALHVILVHGTWGRGFWSNKQVESSGNKHARWFEASSAFATDLREGIQFWRIDCHHHPFAWTGSNSIRERDKAAKELASLVTSLEQRHPDDGIVVIGHSHGGNVAMRMMQHIADPPAKLRIVTLATPFLGIETSRRGALATALKVLMLVLIALLGLAHINPFDPASVTFADTAVVASGGLLAYFCMIGLGISVRNPTESLHRLDLLWAMNFFDYRVAQKIGGILVLRGIDDEASLALALSALTARLARGIQVLTSNILFPVLVATQFAAAALAYWRVSLDLAASVPLMCAAYTWLLTVALVPIGMVALTAVLKSTFGRELLLRSLSCHPWVQSVPDNSGWVGVHTLAREEAYSRGLRHGLYGYSSCTTIVAAWLRFGKEWRKTVLYA